MEHGALFFSVQIPEGPRPSAIPSGLPFHTLPFVLFAGLLVFVGACGRMAKRSLKARNEEVAHQRGVMGSTMGGDAPLHDLPDAKKREEEKRIRKEVRDKYPNDPKRWKKEDNRANEISRRKAKRAHQ